MERSFDRAAHGVSASGRDARAVMATANDKRVRLVCGRCRRRLDSVSNIDGVTYGLLHAARDLESGHRIRHAETGKLVPGDRRTWRCDRCGGNYPGTRERMHVEQRAALERGDRTITLPLPKR